MNFTFSEEIFPIDQVSSKVVSIRCLAELHPHFLNSTEVKDLETSWISDDGAILSSDNTITIENPNKKVSFYLKFRKIKTKYFPS